MTNPLLIEIRSPAFIRSLGHDLPAQAMRRVLLNTPQYHAFRNKYVEGEITDRLVTEFISELMDDFVKNQPFRYDATLAFLAVALSLENFLLISADSA
jgi:hypothetical protein